MLLLAKVRLTQGWENPVRLDDFMYRQQRFSLTYLSIQLGTLIFKKLYCMSMLNFSEKNCEFAWIPEKLYVYRCLHKSFIGNLSLTYYFQSFYKYIYKRTFFFFISTILLYSGYASRGTSMREIRRLNPYFKF